MQEIQMHIYKLFLYHGTSHNLLLNFVLIILAGEKRLTTSPLKLVPGKYIFSANY